MADIGHRNGLLYGEEMYRVVIKRTVVTHEHYMVPGDDEDEAIENATNGYYPVVAVDDEDNHTEVMVADEVK